MNSSYDLTIEEQRIILTLASTVSPNDEDFKTKTYHDDKDIDIEAIKNSEKMFEDVEISSSAANGGG